MSLPVKIVDPRSGISGRVTKNGEVVIAALAYSTPYYVSVDAIATPFEIIRGEAGRQFVLTDMLISSDKVFASSVDSETVIIYEASPSDLSVNLKTFTRVDLLRNDRLPITGLNLVTTTSSSLVAIAADTNVDITLAGYYVPVTEA